MLRTLFATLAFVGIAATASAVELGDDGLHKADWMENTFLDLREDLGDATSQGRRLAIMIEQRGCIYCTKMHEEVYPVPEIDAMLRDDFYVVQLNMFGDREIVDFDGEELSERDAIQKWGVMFTPTIYFFPEEVTQEAPANMVAVAYVPGALGVCMFSNMLNYVLGHGYDTDENFQKYHARVFNNGEGLCAH